MSWEAVQAIAELIAAAGVITSLVYLAIQVRQNTSSIRAAATQELMIGYNAILDFAKQSAHGAKIYDALVRGEVETLPREEQSAVRIATIQIMRLYELAYLQHEAGMLSDDVWEGWRYQIRMSVGLPGSTRSWAAVRPMVGENFATWLDTVAAEGAVVAREYANRWTEAGSSHLFTPDGD